EPRAGEGRGAETPRKVAVEEIREPACYKDRRRRVRGRPRLDEHERHDHRHEQDGQDRDRVRPAETERTHPLPDVVLLRKSEGPNDAVYGCPALPGRPNGCPFTVS